MAAFKQICEFIRIVLLLILVGQDLKERSVRIEPLLFLFSVSCVLSVLDPPQPDAKVFLLKSFVLPAVSVIFISLLEHLSHHLLLGGGDIFVLAALSPAFTFKQTLLLIPLACLCTWPFLVICYTSGKREFARSFPLLPFYIPSFMVLRALML